MSMKSWTEYGYGFPLNSGDNIEAIKKFICDNAQADSVHHELRINDEEKAKIMKCEDTGEIYEILDKYPSCVIAEMINVKEGTTFFRGYPQDCDTDQEEMIGAEPMYSWQMNEKEKSLTQEQITEILEKYAGMLGISAKPDFFNAEYCG